MIDTTWIPRFTSLLTNIFPNDYEFIPNEMIPTKYIKFCFEDIDSLNFSVQDENFQILVDLLIHQLRKIVEVYGENFIFTEPQLIYQPPYNSVKNRVGITIGMMEKEVLEERNMK